MLTWERNIATQKREIATWKRKPLTRLRDFAS